MANSGKPALERSAAGNHSPWLVAVIVSMATFMEVLDTSIANVSLKHIAGNLAATQDESTWVLTSYLVSNAIVLPISGWLATIVGRKRFYIGCVALFGISSFLCGLAPSLGWLIVFRVIQGLGGGGLAPSEQSILADTFPPEQRGQAFALYGVAVVVAPTLGPTLGGWITDNYSWRWIFLINVPVCLLSLFLAGTMLAEPDAVKKDREKLLKGGVRVDYLGIILVATGLGCLQLVLDKGQEEDWFSSQFILVFGIIAALSLLGLVIWECLCDEPIVDIPLMKDKSFASAMMVMFATGFILISTTQLLPQFTQTMMGYSATQAGMALTAGGLATLFLMPMVGTLLKFVQPRYLIAFGLLIECLACYHLRGINTDVNFGHIAWARVFQAVGLPFLFVPISTVAYAGLPAGKSNNASALINTMRNLGGSFGISLAVALLARRGQFHHSRLSESVSVYNHHYHQEPGQTLATIDALVNRQAALLSYLDIFWFLAIIAALMVPLTFLLRHVKAGAAAGH